MYRGSKFMISAFKFLIPIVAAVAAGVIWMREHLDRRNKKPPVGAGRSDGRLFGFVDSWRFSSAKSPGLLAFCPVANHRNKIALFPAGDAFFIAQSAALRVKTSLVTPDVCRFVIWLAGRFGDRTRCCNSAGRGGTNARQ